LTTGTLNAAVMMALSSAVSCSLVVLTERG
jgi:hypothetical protein